MRRGGLVRGAWALGAACSLAVACSHSAPLPSGASADPTPRQARGTLLADTVWEGIVEITDDLLVPTGRTLRVLPGTRIRVRPADTTKTEPEYLDNATELLVRGRLLVEGTPSRPVIFEPLPGAEGSAAEPGSRWGGVIFDRGAGLVSHSRISGAETGVTLLAASPRLSDLEIVDVRQGIAIHRDSAPLLTRVSVRAAEGGVSCWPGSSPQLDGVDAEAAEHEGLLVAPGASPRLSKCRFRGPVAGILWGAAGPPPRGQWGDATVRIVEPAPAEAASPPAPWPFAPPADLPARTPDRVYRGEQFIGEDTAWDGEILIDGTVMLSPTAHLTVAPGTVVRFAFRDTDGDGIGESEVFIQGRITAAGTPDRPVVFTAAGEQGPGRWGAVNLMGSDERESSFTGCLVESSLRGLHSHFSRFRVERSIFRGNRRALQFQESKAVITDTVVTGGTSGLRFRDSTAALEGLAVFGNTLGVQTLRSTFSLTRSTVSHNALAGIHIRESEGTIAGCLIEENAPGVRVSESRVRIEGNRVAANNAGGLLVRRSEARIEGNRIADSRGNAVSIDSPAVVLRGNLIQGSLRFAVENKAPEAVDAVENWWGPGGASGELFFDHDDDPRVGPVLRDPVLSAPPALP